MAKKSPFRVRFAPSPTGWLHIGGLRTALYNYLLAKKHSGQFIVRIEDTDQTRLISGAVEGILTTLERCALRWDEGPFFKKGRLVEKGRCGPYTQSKRLSIYRHYVNELLGREGAYFCFCSQERLEALRREQQLKKQPMKYDGRCRRFSASEAKNLLAEQPQPVVRLKVPTAGQTIFTDIVHGQVSFENSLIDDQILLKSDGFPTYHLASVVDDHLMKISLVLRGEEWLPSAPKHLLLYQAFGWETPQFAHVPLLLNEDKTKLSKRHGEVAVEAYLKRGFLPEALINFVALLGWNPGTEQEIFSLQDLVKQFSLEKVQRAGAVLNLSKLEWLNGHYIRQMPIDKLTEACLPYFKKETGELYSKTKMSKIIALERERLKKLSDIAEATEFFFTKPRCAPPLLIWKKSDRETALARLKRLKNWFDDWPTGWTAKNLEKATLEMIRRENLDNGATLWPMRAALSGREASPGPFDIAAILGKRETIERLKQAADGLQ